MNKKLTALCLAAAMSLCLFGCNNNDKSSLAHQAYSSSPEASASSAEDSIEVSSQAHDNSSSEEITSSDEASFQEEQKSVLQICTEYLDDLSAEMDFTYEIYSEEPEVYNTDYGKRFVTSFLCSADGMAKKKIVYLVVNFEMEVTSISETYPTDVLLFLGVDEKDIKAPAEPTSDNAAALFEMAEDIVLDAKENGFPIADGVYKKGSKSSLSKSIDANLEFQQITAYDYSVTIDGGKVTLAEIFSEDGTRTEIYNMLENKFSENLFS